jgi:hypothetical protein
MQYDMNQGEEGVDLDRAAHLIQNMEDDLRALRQILQLNQNAALGYGSGEQSFYRSQGSNDAEVIEGVFDGERMVDMNGKSFQVSANYASKSKLIEGDPLKLYITADGKYFYKQVGPIERKTIPGVLRQEGNHYIVEAEDGNSYNVLTASVTYYMSLYHTKPGDRVMIMIPANHPARWAVIDNVL